MRTEVLQQKSKNYLNSLNLGRIDTETLGSVAGLELRDLSGAYIEFPLFTMSQRDYGRLHPTNAFTRPTANPDAHSAMIVDWILGTFEGREAVFIARADGPDVIFLLI